MPLNTKTIKRRIKSVGSTKKITRAMEMISAVKMRKAVANAAASRAYANFAWEMLSDISAKTAVAHHPLLARRPVQKIGLLLITSNRGLAGGFSSRLLAKVHDYVQEAETAGAKKVEVMLVGKRGQKIYHRYGHRVAAEFPKVDLTTRVEEVLPLSQMISGDYRNKKYDTIVLAFTDFESALKQTPRLKQLLPIVGTHQLDRAGAPQRGSEFLFEPGPKAALEALLPRLVEMQIYQAILESDASEHSARMLAMAHATDAAEEMITELTYSYHKARQAAITQEIAEVVGGTAALGEN
ncbi:MAG: ATP synthase F1 subunit gamma [Parcubacteria group bacterium]|nr:ATP synthase F1 subunit gamma [Parcubacteria group bacterium]